MSDPLNHLGSTWTHLEPLEVPYSPNQFLGWDFFAVSYCKPALVIIQISYQVRHCQIKYQYNVLQTFLWCRQKKPFYCSIKENIAFQEWVYFCTYNIVYTFFYSNSVVKSRKKVIDNVSISPNEIRKSGEKRS